MAKQWVLDTGTKGTGAHVVPLEDTRENEASKPDVVPRKREPARDRPPRREKSDVRRERAPAGEQKRLSPLAPGHVRKKATGEIGRVKAVDPGAGTVTVTWLASGQTSTVPISATTRRWYLPRGFEGFSFGRTAAPPMALFWRHLVTCQCLCSSCAPLLMPWPRKWCRAMVTSPRSRTSSICRGEVGA